MDWNNPEERAALIEKIGADAYNKEFEAFINESTVAVVCGHAIRPVPSQFGYLFMCGKTGKAFPTLKNAKEYAEMHPVGDDKDDVGTTD